MTDSTHSLGEDSASRKGPGRARPITILLADDHKLVREGIANILKDRASFNVVALAENGLEALEMTGRHLPDVVIMDISMPKLNGIEATRAIKKDFPKVKVIGLSVHDESDVADSMINAGAFVLLNKAGDLKDLMEAIEACVPAN